MYKYLKFINSLINTQNRKEFETANYYLSKLFIIPMFKKTVVNVQRPI